MSLRLLPTRTLVFWLLAGLSLSSLAFAWVGRLTQKERSHQFRREVESRVDGLRSRIDTALQDVEATAAFVSTFPGVRRTQFAQFTKMFLHRPSTQALEWAPRIEASERSAFESGIQKEGWPGFEIREKRGQLQRAEARNEWFPVLYAEPAEKNLGALGFDLASSPIRREAIERAWYLHRPVATAPIRLVQDEEKVILIMHPVYGEAQKLLGVVVGVFKIQQFFREGFGEHEPRDIRIALYDKGATDAGDLLWQSKGHPPAPNLREIALDYHLEVATRRWVLQVWAAPNHPLLDWMWGPWAAAASVFCATMLLLRYLRFVRRAERAILATNQELENRVSLRSAELAQANEEMSAIFRAHPDFVFVVDPDGRFLGFRGNVSKLYVAPEEFLGHTIADVMPPANARQLMDAVRGAHLTGEMVTVQYPLGEGTDLHYYEARMLPLEKNRILAVVREITESTKSENARRESEIRFRSTFDNAAVGIALVDIDGNFQEFNERLCQILGYPREELVGRPFRDFTYKDDIEPNLTLLSRMHKGEIPGFSLEKRYIQKDGSMVWGLVTVAPSRDPSGKIRFLIAVLQDITERKVAEAALQKSEARLRAMIAATPDCVKLVDKEGRVLEMNAAGLALVEADSQDQVVGRSVLDLVVPEHRETYLIFHQKICSGQPSTLRFDVVGMRGTRRTMESHAVPLFTPEGAKDGESVLHLAITRDVTEAVATEKRIRQMNMDLEARVAERTAELATKNARLFEALEERMQIEKALSASLEREKELGELKSRFVSMASHEFRTPLTTIFTASDNLRRYYDRMTKEQRDERLEKIQSQVRHMTMILEDVLLLGRSNLATKNVKLVEFDLLPLCHEIISDLAANSSTNPEIRFSYQGEPVQLKGDPTLIRHILSNLIGNACKYSAAGSTVEVELGFFKDSIELSVNDHGIGIPEDDLPHLFTPFHRAANAGSISGTGLGLAITKNAVELHRGTLTVKSTEKVGSRFTVRLPKDPEQLGSAH